MNTSAHLPEAPPSVQSAVEDYPAPEVVIQQALPNDWAAERARFQADPDKFCDAVAKEFTWSKPWGEVCEWDGVHHK